MELDDLKAEWQSLHSRLDQQAARHHQLHQELRLDRVSRSLRPLFWGSGLQIAMGGLLAILSASFWIHHRSVLHLLLPGLLFHAYGLAMIVCGVRVLVLGSRLDYAAPVVEIQRRLATLRRFYMRCGRWIGLPWFVLWVPLQQLLFMGLLGVDLYQHAPGMVLSNVAGGVVLWGAFLLLGRWASGRPGLGPRIERLLAGRSLTQAEAALAELETFERN